MLFSPPDIAWLACLGHLMLLSPPGIVWLACLGQLMLLLLNTFKLFGIPKFRC